MAQLELGHTGLDRHLASGGLAFHCGGNCRCTLRDSRHGAILYGRDINIVGSPGYFVIVSVFRSDRCLKHSRIPRLKSQFRLVKGD